MCAQERMQYADSLSYEAWKSIFFSSNHHNLSLDVICGFRASAGSGFRHVLHTGETWVSVLLLLLPQARFVSTAKPSISLGGKSSLSKRETSPHSAEHTADLFLMGSGWDPGTTFSTRVKGSVNRPDWDNEAVSSQESLCMMLMMISQNIHQPHHCSLELNLHCSQGPLSLNMWGGESGFLYPLPPIWPCINPNLWDGNWKWKLCNCLKDPQQKNSLFSGWVAGAATVLQSPTALRLLHFISSADRFPSAGAEYSRLSELQLSKLPDRKILKIQKILKDKQSLNKI